MYQQFKRGLLSQRISVELQDAGLTYKLVTKRPFRKEGVDEEYIPYGAIENSRLREKKTNTVVKGFFVNASIVVIVVYYIALFSLLGTDTSPSPYQQAGALLQLLVYLPLFLWFPLYSFFVTQKVIYFRARDSYYAIFDNPEGEEIFKAIFERRKTFFRKTFLEGESLDSLNEVNIEFLRANKVVDDVEFERLKRTIKERARVKAVGFETVK